MNKFFLIIGIVLFCQSVVYATSSEHFTGTYTAKGDITISFFFDTVHVSNLEINKRKIADKLVLTEWYGEFNKNPTLLTIEFTDPVYKHIHHEISIILLNAYGWSGPVEFIFCSGYYVKYTWSDTKRVVLEKHLVNFEFEQTMNFDE